MASEDTQDSPRKFAAKYRSKWQGWVAVAFGTSWLISGEPALMVVGALMIGLGVFFLRGRGTSPRAIERAQKKADKVQSRVDEAVRSLESSSGGRAVVAYRNLEGVMKSTKSPNYQASLTQILQDIDFDKSRLDSVHIGSISGPGILNRVPIEIYKDWIIVGQAAYDVDASTRGEVHVEGNVQIDAKGNKRDMRTAFVNFVSTDWSHTFPFNLDQVSDARRYVAQLAAVTDALKPTGITSSDIAKMIETILNNSGQPAAEKLKQLSDLRYQRLLSDAEFESAKAKILGI